eukprot:1138128-Pelagomonas_calceolata.AAC.1
MAAATACRVGAACHACQMQNICSGFRLGVGVFRKSWMQGGCGLPCMSDSEKSDEECKLYTDPEQACLSACMSAILCACMPAFSCACMSAHFS